MCYSGYYDDPRTEEERNNALDAANKNRAMRAETIRSEKASGLLAFADGKLVGWCNVGPKSNYRNLRNLVPEPEDKESIGSILCFVVVAPYRGKGVGTSLLNSACEKLCPDGFQIAEAYPRTLPRLRKIPATPRLRT